MKTQDIRCSRCAGTPGFMVSVGLFFVALQQAPSPDANLQTALDRVDQYVAQNLTRHRLPNSPVPIRVPSVALAIVRDQEVLLCRGYGYADLAHKVPATGDTVYRLGSISKVFTATVLMQQRDHGKLSLDDPIERFLKEFRIRSDPRRAITFRQIVSHTAGLPRQAPLPSWSTLKFPSRLEMLNSLARAEPVLPPYTASHYSNLGFDCLGLALERVTRSPWTACVSQGVLLPLKMDRTYLELSKVPVGALATGYMPNFKSISMEPVPAPKIELGEAMAPAGAVCSTASDMAKFLSFQFRDNPESRGPVLPGNTLREMRQPGIVWDDWSGGIGICWFLSKFEGETKVGHGGAIHGYVCDMTFLPHRKLGVVLLSNGWIDAAGMVDHILRELIPVTIPIKPTEEPQASDAWRDLEGIYAEPNNPGYRVRVDAGRLFLEEVVLGIPISRGELLPEGKLFRCRGGAFDLESAEFVSGADGKVKLLRIGGGGRELTRTQT